MLVDYNQNAWGRTLASIYSVRPRPEATVSTPVTWEEVEKGIRIEDFTVMNVPDRVAKIGDLWKPLLAARGRFDLAPVPLTRMLVRDFDFDLPPALIAQEPAADRSGARLLHLPRTDRAHRFIPL